MIGRSYFRTHSRNRSIFYIAASGNFQPFNASGNIHQIARLKRLLNTHSRHFGASDELLLTTQSCQI
jgi:hypothetical protein